MKLTDTQKQDIFNTQDGKPSFDDIKVSTRSTCDSLDNLLYRILDSAAPIDEFNYVLNQLNKAHDKCIEISEKNRESVDVDEIRSQYFDI